MFTLTDTPVKFVCLLVLFAWCLVWEVTALVRSHGAAARTSSALHVVMCVVMLAMVPRSWWMPFHQAVPLPVLIGVMLACCVWFAIRIVRAHTGHRSHPVICLAMFATMAWHLWAMQVKMSHTMTMSTPPMSGMDHSGMDHMHMSGGGMAGAMPASPWQAQASMPGHVLWWFALAGVVLVLAMLWVAIRDLAMIAQRRGNRAALAAEFAMCFGMAWMSTGLLAPVAPWVHVLAF